MDYYNILGIDRNADPKQIKNAYRKLASKHHPDKGGDADEFKKVQAAYDTLSDPERKQMYDQFGTDDPQQMGGNPFGGESPFFNFDEIFGNIRGGPFRQQQQRNPDGVTEVFISVMHAYKGGDVVIDVGYTREIVQIEAGTQDGSRLRLRGKGPNRIKTAPPGDLIVNIRIDTPPNIQIQGTDVYQMIEVNALDAMMGAEITITHFTGNKLNVKIPAGIQPGAKLRLTGQGWPVIRRPARGNLFIIVNIIVPKIQNIAHIDMLNTIKEENNNE